MPTITERNLGGSLYEPMQGTGGVPQKKSRGRRWSWAPEDETMRRAPVTIPKSLVGALLVLLALQVGNASFGKLLWVNLTDSEPKGLYRLHRMEGGVKRGDVVLMEVPEEFRSYVYGRRWLPAGWPLIKHVGAVPGDIFCVAGRDFSVNGAPLGPVFEVDREGLPLPRVQGCRVIPPGNFLPVGLGMPRSFDGRYMGPVRCSRIRGRLTPVWTF